MRKVFLLGLMSLFLMGCATAGIKIDRGKVQQIKEGITTEQEVVELFGKPFMVNLTSDGKTIMMYQYVKMQSKASNFIPVVNILASGIDMHQQILQILINQDGRVEKYILSDAESDIKTGLFNTN